MLLQNAVQSQERSKDHMFKEFKPSEYQHVPISRVENHSAPEMGNRLSQRETSLLKCIN